jgi:hypothetical protein
VEVVLVDTLENGVAIVVVDHVKRETRGIGEHRCEDISNGSGHDSG